MAPPFCYNNRPYGTRKLHPEQGKRSCCPAGIGSDMLLSLLAASHRQPMRTGRDKEMLKLTWNGIVPCFQRTTPCPMKQSKRCLTRWLRWQMSSRTSTARPSQSRTRLYASRSRRLACRAMSRQFSCDRMIHAASVCNPGAA